MKPFIYKLEDVYKASEQKLFTVVSTFAGCGGSSTGYRLAGGDILAVNEFIPAAQEAYRRNYPNTLILPDDIRTLTGKDILDKTGLAKGELDILDGSPPCASFSFSGKREKMWGKEKVYSDTTQRTDDLFFEFARLIKDIQPKVFIAENVKGITVGKARGLVGTGSNSLWEEEKEETILDALISAGYRVKYRVINAAHYGVPQLRERTIFIGIRNDIKKEITYPKISYDFVSVKDATSNLEKTILPQLWVKPTNRCFKLWEQAKYGQQFDEIFISENGKPRYYNYIRLDPDKPCVTVLTDPNIFHWDEKRYLAIEEFIRISSFPDDYYLGDRLTKQYERIGRAVPPLMMKAIAEHVYNTILKP